MNKKTMVTTIGPDMKYRVDWSRSAQEGLAELWNEAFDRTIITEVADSIDVALSQDPIAFGESRDDPLLYVGFHLPLGVSYEVDEGMRRVGAVGVWRVRAWSLDLNKESVR